MMNTKKYPVANTSCPTPLDARIAKMTDWLEQNNHPLWETAQSAPSEISFKIYIIGFLLADGDDGVADWCDGETDRKPAPVQTLVDLRNHPATTLADLEWEYGLVKNTIAGPRILKRIEAFKKSHGIA